MKTCEVLKKMRYYVNMVKYYLGTNYKHAAFRDNIWARKFG